MHRETRGIHCLYLLALCGILLAGSGCSFVKVPQGWLLRTGWSLEFHRMPFYAGCAQSCEPSCDTACEPSCDTRAPSCNSNAPSPRSQPNAPTQPAKSPEPMLAPQTSACDRHEDCDSTSLTDVLRRKGRLGICTTCGKLGRFKDKDKEVQPAVPSTMPVVAKFHPVPTAPVFCPQPNPTKPAGFESPVEKKKTSSNKPVPIKKATLPPKPQKVPPPSSKPEAIPSPPPTSSSSKSEKAPREFELPAEPPEWVFTNAEAKADPPAEKTSTKIRACEPLKRQ